MANIKNNLVAKRYSDALMSLVRERGLNIQDINSQLKAIYESLSNSQELSSFMFNPSISSDDKRDVISKLLDGKVDNILLNFIKILVEKERFGAIEEITNIFDKEVYKINNVKKVRVTSAISLNENLRQRLVEKLSSKLNKQIELSTTVNPDIIAGLVIEIDDNVIDVSLKHKFEEMKMQMIK